jgi:uncharacterized protein
MSSTGIIIKTAASSRPKRRATSQLKKTASTDNLSSSSSSSSNTASSRQHLIHPKRVKLDAAACTSSSPASPSRSDEKNASTSTSTSPVFLFAHGAGAGCKSDWMQRWITLLQTIGDVVPFDYPYMVKRGRGPPDRQPKLVAAHQEQLDQVLQDYDEHRPVYLIGKSMGSRMGCHVAVDTQCHGIAGLICFGYPLRGASGKMRDQVLKDLPSHTRILFLSGTRDRLCPLDSLRRTIKDMDASATLYVLEGGDHSLHVPKRKYSPQPVYDAQLLSQIKSFVA